MAQSGVVLVTGASGYIAIHCVKQLLEAGREVRGTVRDLQKEKKLKPIRDLADDQSKLELVQADLLDADSWTSAVAGCEYVLHVASPVLMDPENEDALVKPAVDGTLNVLRACAATKGAIKRVVLTSSVAAVDYGTPGEKSGEIRTFNEDDWTDTKAKNVGAYVKSKTLAEKAAWDFVKDLPDDEKFELVSLCPGFVTGPLIHDIECMSAQLVARFIRGGMPFVPRLLFSCVDVRDVAAAHITALEEPAVAGERIILSTELLWFKDIATHLSNEFGPQGYKISTTEAPSALLWLMSWWDKTVRVMLPRVGFEYQIDNSKMKTELKITEPIAPAKSLVDMGYSLIERGFIPKTKKYHGPEQEGEKETETKEGDKEEDTGKETTGSEDKGEAQPIPEQTQEVVEAEQKPEEAQPQDAPSEKEEMAEPGQKPQETEPVEQKPEEAEPVAAAEPQAAHEKQKEQVVEAEQKPEEAEPAPVEAEEQKQDVVEEEKQKPDETEAAQQKEEVVEPEQKPEEAQPVPVEAEEQKEEVVEEKQKQKEVEPVAAAEPQDTPSEVAQQKEEVAEPEQKPQETEPVAAPSEVTQQKEQVVEAEQKPQEAVSEPQAAIIEHAPLPPVPELQPEVQKEKPSEADEHKAEVVETKQKQEEAESGAAAEPKAAIVKQELPPAIHVSEPPVEKGEAEGKPLPAHEPVPGPKPQVEKTDTPSEGSTEEKEQVQKESDEAEEKGQKKPEEHEGSTKKSTK